MDTMRNQQGAQAETENLGNLTAKEIQGQMYSSFGIIVDEREAISFAAWIILKSGSQLPLVAAPGNPELQKIYREIGLN